MAKDFWDWLDVNAAIVSPIHKQELIFRAKDADSAPCQKSQTSTLPIKWDKVKF